MVELIISGKPVQQQVNAPPGASVTVNFIALELAGGNYYAYELSPSINVPSIVIT